MFGVLLRYLSVSICAFALVFLFLAVAPTAKNTNASFKECRVDPTSACLADLGFEKAMSRDSLPLYMREITWLARMGRIEDAIALSIRVEQEKGTSLETAQTIADRRVASHRLAIAVRSGADLEQAIENVPAVDAGTLWISALDLLGREPYGLDLRPAAMPDERTINVVNEIAQRIAIIAKNEPTRPKITHLIYAAKLHAALGNRQSAISTLQQIPNSKEPLTSFPTELIRTIGVRTALNIYHDAGGRSQHIFLNAALVEHDAAESRRLLEKAFDAYSSHQPWPDFSKMARTVLLSVELGHRDLSLRLARAMARQAESTRYPFQMFGNIDAAKALSAANAPKKEIRNSIDHALSLFPDHPSRTLAYGHVSGPIQWERSGLKNEAQVMIANLLAQSGDLEGAVQLMNDLEDPSRSWSNMLTPDIPAESYDALLLAASEVLNPQDLAYVQAQLAADIFRSEASEAHRAWALVSAGEIIDQDQFAGDRALAIYSSALSVAIKANAPELETKALHRIANAAMASRNYTDLIQAGLKWHLREPD